MKDGMHPVLAGSHDRSQMCGCTLDAHISVDGCASIVGALLTDILLGFQGLAMWHG
jgi:hypothetical protein